MRIRPISPKKVEREPVTLRSTVNNLVNNVSSIWSDPLINKLLTAYSQDIHRVMHNPGDVTFLKAWHMIGRRPAASLGSAKYLVPESQWYALRPLGFLAMLVHRAGSDQESWDAVRSNLCDVSHAQDSNPHAKDPGSEANK